MCPTITENIQQTITDQDFLQDVATPRWIKDVFRFLPIKSQFILFGNIRDKYPFRTQNGKYNQLFLTQYLVDALALKGYQYFIEFDMIDGFKVPNGDRDAEAYEFFKNTFKLNFDTTGRIKSCKCSLKKSLEIIEQIVNCKEHLIVTCANFASRYSVRAESLTEIEHEYFTKALMLSHSAVPHQTSSVKDAKFNPIFWICDKENDLPDWLSHNNPRIRSVAIPKPDHIIRRAMIYELSKSLPEYTEVTDNKITPRDAFVEQTEGMTLTDVISITQLCRNEQLKYRDIEEAVRRYKLGVTEDPWKRLERKKIVEGEEFICQRVKGQKQSVTKALDIIKRAVTGLSGAQGSKVGGRPRGILFLAGPTGTGKTELAKTLTQLLFGDERAYIRFDMSEFSAEQADQRLLGAPPGYVGYDAGGELTNAIREKPFSVVLFDEIEKAHPRILDKFLQLLDDGTLTSGRGERVYFSESVIVFTSNLGIYRIDDDGKRVLNVSPEDDRVTVEQKVRSEIENYFKTKLNRPEILNRIGENIVVFDFIRQDVAAEIYKMMVSNILARLADRQKINVTLSEGVGDVLLEHCIRDLSNGGRGIGNQLEAWLINPLARALFDNNVKEGALVTVTAVEEVNGVPTVRLHG